MSKIENKKIELDNSINMNDEDRLTTILNIEKNMSVNMTIALNEASNEYLYNQLWDHFETIKDLQRDIFEILFQYGWYSLETAEETKINDKLSELNQKLEYIKTQDF